MSMFFLSNGGRSGLRTEHEAGRCCSDKALATASAAMRWQSAAENMSGGSSSDMMASVGAVGGDVAKKMSLPSKIDGEGVRRPDP